MQILALADDATGALEVGARFAASGVSTAVAIDAEPEWGRLESYTAVVVDAATRHLPSEAAAARLRSLATAAKERGIPHIYKKTDSTLRGPIPAEFDALLEVWPERGLIYAPAYPAMGRQVIGGELFVDGLPVHQTAFAQDPLNASRESSIPRLLERGCRARLQAARSAEQMRALLEGGIAGAILVCDGREDADLEAIAEVLSSGAPPYLAAGAGGFAGYWVRALPVGRTATRARPAARRWLVVNGSLHPRSQQQIETCGLPRISPADRFPPSHSWAVLATASEPLGAPLEVAARLGAETRRIVERDAVEGLVVFGGDTARAVAEALEERIVEPCGELLPGIPIARLLRRGLALASKAGGFGPPDVIARIRSAWERGA